MCAQGVLSPEGPSPSCGGACVVRDVRHDGGRCVRGARRGRACELRAGGWAGCLRATVRARARGGGRGGWACEDARGPAPPRPGVWPAGETREGAAVNPFLPDLKLGASGPSARGLPQHVAGGQSWLGEDPSREQRAPPRLPWKPELPAQPGACFPPLPALPPAPQSNDNALPAPDLRRRGLGSLRPAVRDSGQPGGPLAATGLAPPSLPL
jgi:hypothetical protein